MRYLISVSCLLSAQALLADEVILQTDQTLWTITERPTPSYPRAAAIAGKQGCVSVRFTVHTDGQTGQIAVVQSYPDNTFDQSALEAIAGWQFKPTETNIEREPVAMQQTLTYQIGTDDTGSRSWLMLQCQSSGDGL